MQGNRFGEEQAYGESGGGGSEECRSGHVEVTWGDQGTDKSEIEG